MMKYTLENYNYINNISINICSSEVLKVVSISGMYIYIIQQKHILALIAFQVTTESSKSTAIFNLVKYNFILKTIILLLKL